MSTDPRLEEALDHVLGQISMQCMIPWRRWSQRLQHPPALDVMNTALRRRRARQGLVRYQVARDQTVGFRPPPAAVESENMSHTDEEIEEAMEVVTELPREEEWTESRLTVPAELPTLQMEKTADRDAGLRHFKLTFSDEDIRTLEEEHPGLVAKVDQAFRTGQMPRMLVALGAAAHALEQSRGVRWGTNITSRGELEGGLPWPALPPWFEE